MSATLSPTSAIACEILARRVAEAAALAKIAALCAHDVGQPLAVSTRALRDPRGRSAGESLITLHLPAAVAATDHRIWCLACRLACFCPGARVSVLVQAEATFAPGGGKARQARVQQRQAAA